MLLNALQNCRNKSWDATAKYLTDDLPHILSSKEIKDVQELLETVMSSAPADLRDFINWIAEVRLLEDGSKLTEEEKARLYLKVCYVFAIFLYLFLSESLFLIILIVLYSTYYLLFGLRNGLKRFTTNVMVSGRGVGPSAQD